MASQRKEFNKVVMSSLYDLNKRVQHLEAIIGHIITQAQKAYGGVTSETQDVVPLDVVGSDGAANEANQEILPMGAIGLEDGDFTGDDRA